MINLETHHLLFIVTGCVETLKYSLISVLCGFIIGNFIAVSRIFGPKPLQWAAKIYVSLFRGTPVIIQLSLLYYGFAKYSNIDMSAFQAGVIAFSLNSAAYVSEIVRSGVSAIDKGQFEAAEALGISKQDALIDIILPQAYRNISPALMNEFVNLIKESAIISIIGGSDVMQRAKMVAAEKYDFFTPMIIAAICYYVMVLIFSTLAGILEKNVKSKY